MTGLATERRLKHFGWGREGEGLTPVEEKAALDRYCRLFGVAEFDEAMPPPLAAIELPPPRLVPPAPLAACCSDAAYDRVAHTYGKSFSDYARGLQGDYRAAPDIVAYPRDEAEVAAILDWAGGAGAARLALCSATTAMHEDGGDDTSGDGTAPQTFRMGP